ncbi:MAG: hypothetical protein GY749_13545 [Desulfobacteraceae bacterium]|nr:hypothetical protein [Desulfobacteraceae bacterium]
MTAECFNQMTVITANQHTWTETIRPWWQEAHLARLSSPLELEGVTIKQAEELIEHRLDEWKVETDTINIFYDKEWLNALFKDANELGIRDFLKRCNKRWQVRVAGKKGETATIAEYYQKTIEDIKTQPKRLVFEPSTLYWVIYEVARGLSEFKVEKYKSRKGYYVLLWKSEDRQISTSAKVLHHNLYSVP